MNRIPPARRVSPERPAAFALLHQSGLFDAAYYTAQNAIHDAAPPGADPLVHFCTIGWRTGRKPNPYFDPAFYLETSPDVAAAGLNPLLHYIEFGDSEGRHPALWFHTGWYRREYGVPEAENALAHFLVRRNRGQVSPVPLFDPGWYLETNPDVAAAGTDPFEHFMAFGEIEDRDPSPEFDIHFYRTRYKAELNGQNPLLHYLAHQNQGFHPRRPGYERLIAGAVRAATRPAPEFEEVQRLPESVSRRAMLLAYYLPQFHTTPENDAWWGKGFTDWTNLARATPRFAGHYQPRIPRDLGFYTLDDPRTLPRQIDLAKGAGLGGFVFYYYWFNGKRLLEAPLDQLRQDKSLDFPFCLMWANENWTRRWDGLDREVLLAQEYDEADDAALIDDFAGYFADPRYIRLDGRPLLMIYRAALIPDAQVTIARWRALFAERHGENPLIFMAQSFHDNDPATHGLDGAVEFPPHKLVVDAPKLNNMLDLFDPEFTAAVHRYDDIVAVSLAVAKPKYPLIRTIVPGWDNDPRREGNGVVLHEAKPAKYQIWLEALIDYARANPVSGAPVLCVNAWNEWAEGAYLEPDIHYGAAFLNATARAISGQSAADTARHLLLVGHDALRHGSQLLLLHLARALRRQHGVTPHILLLATGPLAAEYEKAGILHIAADAAARKTFIARYRRLGIRAAIVNTAASAFLCEALEDAGIEPTLLIHEMPRLVQEKSLQGAVKRGMAAARHVVFSSAYVRDALCADLAVTPRAAKILPQGNYQRVGFSAEARHAFRRELGVPDESLVVLGAGFADLRKGFDWFLQIWRMATKARPGVHFVWLGELHASLTDYLGGEIAAAEATGSFHRLPFVADVAPAYAAADVLALTSREDPFPTTVIEAMAAGVPSVAFEAAGGIPDLLRETRTGAVAPFGDVQGFADAVLSLLDHGRLSAGREKLMNIAQERFDFGQYTASLLGIANPALKRIAVMVPNYNHARHLPARLSAIFGQTYPVAGVTLLDDVSTDDSAAVAKRVADDWNRGLSIHRSATNSGSAFGQWRRAAEQAQGEYLWIAEADDEAEPRFLARLIDAMGQARNPVLAFADSRAVDADGATLSPDYRRYYAEAGALALAQSSVFPARDFARRFLAERNLILNVSGVLFKREVLAAALGRLGSELDTWRLAGDWRIYLEILTHSEGEVVYIAEPLNIHRRHQAGITQSLDAARHVAEIARMQGIARDLLALDEAAIARQKAYLAAVSAQLGADLPEAGAQTAKTRVARRGSGCFKPEGKDSKGSG